MILLLEGSLIVGGTVAAVGTGASLADDDPAPSWRRAAVILGPLNLLAAMPIMVLGFIADAATALIVIGGTQALVGVADVVLAIMSAVKSGARGRPKHAAFRFGPLARHALYGARIAVDF